MVDGMVTMVDYQCSHLLGERFHRLAPVLPERIELDDVERIDDLMTYAHTVDLTNPIRWLHEVF
jgi:hypothetical protein